MSIRNRAVKAMLAKSPRVDQDGRKVFSSQQEALADFDSRWRELQAACAPPSRHASVRFLVWLRAWLRVA